MLRLHVVERRDRARAMNECGMDRRILDALAAYPDFGFELAQRGQIIVAGPRAHQTDSCIFALTGFTPCAPCALRDRWRAVLSRPVRATKKSRSPWTKKKSPAPVSAGAFVL